MTAILLIVSCLFPSGNLLLSSRSVGWNSPTEERSSCSLAALEIMSRYSPMERRSDSLIDLFQAVPQSPFSPSQGEKVADRPDERVFAGSYAVKFLNRVERRACRSVAWRSLFCTLSEQRLWPALRSDLCVLAVGSLTDRSITWPSWSQWKRVLLLQDYNTRVVMLGTMLLGLAAGTIGSFTLLRRRALMGDALSHATLPGVGLAFLIAPRFGLDGKSLPVLLTGAALSGIAGVAAILYVRNLTRLKEDAALGIVLSVFFGAGIAILTIIQQMPTGHAAGLESFIYGKTASMIASDAALIAWSGLFSVTVIGLLFKEVTLLCFDEGFAGSRGYPLLLLDLVLMALVVIVTIIGLQAVGLVLMIALLVIPAAAARFWTQNLKRMTLISAGIGGAGGLIGSAMSAVFPNLPSGAMIVLVCSGLFFISMLLGTARGVLVRAMRRRKLNRTIDRQHLLRGFYERFESHGSSGMATPATTQRGIPFSELLVLRSWSPYRLLRQIERCRRDSLLVRNDDASLSLTNAGMTEASRLAHEHRLWEIYLITHADVAPGRVDQSADAIEHVLEPELIARLEKLLQQERGIQGVAPSPHPLDQPGGT